MSICSTNTTVLLMHARDPDDPSHRWWELPASLPTRLEAIVTGNVPSKPIVLHD